MDEDATELDLADQADLAYREAQDARRERDRDRTLRTEDRQLELDL